MKKYLFVCLGAILFLSGFKIANAALVQGNDSNQVAGDDGFNLTIDTDTNLQWLDLTATDARSYNDVELNFASGGDFEGYRHATREEVLNFWTNAGINYTANFIHQPDNRLAILDLMDLLGLTFESSTDGVRRIAGGWFDDIANRPTATSPSRAFLEQNIPLVPGGLCSFPECVAAFVYTESVFTFDSIQPATGHYLVADQVSSACTLGMVPSYIDGTLNIDVTLGTSVPVDWNVWLSFQTNTVLLWSIPIPVIDPSESFPISIPQFPQLGIIGFLTTLTTPGGIICSDWATVDTGPAAAATVPRMLGK